MLSRRRLQWCAFAIMSLGLAAVAMAQSGRVQGNPFTNSAARRRAAKSADEPSLVDTAINLISEHRMIAIAVVAVVAMLIVWRMLRRSPDGSRRGWREVRIEWAIRAQPLQEYYDIHTIRRAIRCYTWPRCSLSDGSVAAGADEDTEPAEGQGLRDQMDAFLKRRRSARYMLILGDSGTGKTSFLLNYLAHNHRKMTLRREIRLIHLGSDDCEELIRKVANPKRTVLFLDGLDEDLQAAQHGRQNRIAELLEICKEFKRVVITSHARFLPPTGLLPAEKPAASEAAASKRSSKKADNQAWQVMVCHLSPWNKEEIGEYLQRRYPNWQEKRREQTRDFVLNTAPQLCTRPLILAHIGEIFVADRRTETATEIFASMFDSWLERESATVENSDALRQFARKLAFEIVSKRGQREGEFVSKRELSKLMKQWKLEIPVQRLSARSLIHRDAAGNYRFVHRSILEYLFVAQLLRNPLPEGVDVLLSDVSRLFLSDGLGKDFMGLPSVTACRAYSPQSTVIAKGNTMMVEGKVFVIEEQGTIWVSGVLQQTSDGSVASAVARAIKDGLYGGSKLSAQQRSTWTKGGDIGEAGLTAACLDTVPAARGSSWLADSPNSVTVSAPSDAVYLLPGGFAVCSSAGPNGDLVLTGPGAWSIT